MSNLVVPSLLNDDESVASAYDSESDESTSRDSPLRLANALVSFSPLNIRHKGLPRATPSKKNGLQRVDHDGIFLKKKSLGKSMTAFAAPLLLKDHESVTSDDSEHDERKVGENPQRTTLASPWNNRPNRLLRASKKNKYVQGTDHDEISLEKDSLHLARSRLPASVYVHDETIDREPFLSDSSRDIYFVPLKYDDIIRSKKCCTSDLEKRSPSIYCLSKPSRTRFPMPPSA